MHRGKNLALFELECRDIEREVLYAIDQNSEPFPMRERVSLKAKGVQSFSKKLKNKLEDPPYTCMEDAVCASQLAQLATTHRDKTEGGRPTSSKGLSE